MPVFVADIRTIGLWCKMGMEMQVGDLERAVKKALGALAAREDVLVQCTRGKRRSSASMFFCVRFQ